ncbi:MAG: hypothetical protein HOK41_00020, partial [Nitrospina sp.]|nr:hypothetical protein [Nitrospina sp.]
MNSLSNPEASSPAEFWHTQPEADLLLKLEATSKGLSKQEAQLRLKTHGPNQLPQAEPPAWWIIAIRQFVKG